MLNKLLYIFYFIIENIFRKILRSKIYKSKHILISKYKFYPHFSKHWVL